MSIVKTFFPSLYKQNISSVTLCQPNQIDHVSVFAFPLHHQMLHAQRVFTQKHRVYSSIFNRLILHGIHSERNGTVHMFVTLCYSKPFYCIHLKKINTVLSINVSSEFFFYIKSRHYVIIPAYKILFLSHRYIHQCF